MTKVISNLAKYTIVNCFISGLSVQGAVAAAVVKIGGTFGSALVTIIAVPLLYPIFKRVFVR